MFDVLYSDINVTDIVYTAEKYIFNGCCWKYGSIFIILLAVLAPKFAISYPATFREFELIAVQGHPRSSILVTIENAYATSY